MRYVIYGAGAVGGGIAGRLHSHGHEVVVIARGAHLEAIKAGGLEVRSSAGTEHVALEAVGHPGELDLGAGDVVLLAMKTQDTAAALEQLSAAAPADLVVVCAQNGVDNERQALRRFSRVYGMAVLMPATHLEPGVVCLDAAPVAGILDLGRYPSGTDDLAEAVAADLSGSTFASIAHPEIMRRKYRKLLANLGNALDAAIGRESRGGDLLQRARAEATACLSAARIEVGSEEEDKERRTSMRLAPTAQRSGSSSWQSLARGTGSIEADYLNGEIVLLGRLHGIATPVNAALARVANRLARDGASPGSMSEADVEAEVEAAIAVAARR